MRYVVVLLAALFLSAGSISAQDMKDQPLSPGKKLKFEIKFEGPDAEKIKTLTISLILDGSELDNQNGFQHSCASAPFNPSSPKTFQPEITIPGDIASGTYHLQVDIVASQTGNAEYRAGPGKDFDMHTFKIENEQTFKKPKIKVTER